MLEMSCCLAVTSADSPAVFVKPDVSLPHCYHWFNGYAHTGFQHYTIPTSTIVWNLRILVHLATYSVSGKFADYAITMGFAMFLHRTADVSQMMSCYCIFNTFVERLFCDPEECLYFVADFTDTECVA